MRPTSLVYVGLALVLAAGAQVARAAVYNMEVLPERKDGVYKAGEEVVFRIGIREDGRAPVGKQVAYAITKDDGAQVAGGSVAITAKPTLVKAKLDGPGFLKCTVTLAAGGATIIESGSAAVAPETFKASTAPPDDFDAFWQAQRQSLASKPAEAISKPAQVPDRASPPVKQAAAGVIIDDVQVPTIDGVAPMYAYVARPRNARPKSLPAILIPPMAASQEFGGGPMNRPAKTVVVVTDSDIGRAVMAAKNGMLALSYNVHGVPNAQDSRAYQALAAGELKDALVTGAGDRETHLLRGVILRQMRAIDFLAQHPHWNGKVLIVQAHNLGGGLALAAAALDPRVTFCVAALPATCDLTAPAATAWPHVGASGDEKAKQAARYFDGVNFASRVKCQTIMTVDYGSEAAPPAGVYAAFASIPAEVPKQMFRWGGVVQPRQVEAQIDAIVRKHATAATAIPAATATPQGQPRAAPATPPTPAGPR